jgi:Cu/Ag efflux protein CusF
MRKCSVTLSVLLLTFFVIASGIVKQVNAYEKQDKTLQGKVSSVDESSGELKIKDDQGAEKTLQVSPSTKISKGGKEIKLSELKPGDEVQCVVEGEDDSPSVKEIEVVT